ncbi:MAG: hypothetical protein IPK79_12425 [Vampirovibrionales bacterium]|nr:hypothetical protein [Vampirovibrionales bacterium]
MARFVYRLQKVFDLRERRCKIQLQAVIEAQQAVYAVEAKIEAKRNEIRLVHQHLLTGPHMMMESHDRYLHRCHEEHDYLVKVELVEAQRRLHEEQALYERYLADLKALEKHRDKAREAWQEEEKRLELKMLDEVGSQRYFRAQLEREQDDQEEEELKQEELKQEELRQEELRQEELKQDELRQQELEQEALQDQRQRDDALQQELQQALREERQQA